MPFASAGLICASIEVQFGDVAGILPTSDANVNNYRTFLDDLFEVYLIGIRVDIERIGKARFPCSLDTRTSISPGIPKG